MPSARGAERAVTAGGARGSYAPGIERREHLLHTVLRLIAENGVSGVTHRAVAKEAGVPLGSTTYYFKTKDDMIRSALRFYSQRMEQVMDEEALRAADRTLTVDQVVDSIANVMLQEFEDPDSMLIAEFELILTIAREPTFAPEYRAIQEQFEQRLGNLLRAVGSQSPAQHARMVLAVTRGYEFGWFAQPDARPSKETLREDLRRLISALVSAKDNRH